MAGEPALTSGFSTTSWTITWHPYPETKQRAFQRLKTAKMSWGSETFRCKENIRYICLRSLWSKHLKRVLWSCRADKLRKSWDWSSSCSKGLGYQRRLKLEAQGGWTKAKGHINVEIGELNSETCREIESMRMSPEPFFQQWSETAAVWSATGTAVKRIGAEHVG